MGKLNTNTESTTHIDINEFIANSLLASMRDRGVTGHQLASLGLVSEWNGRHFASRLAEGKIPSGELFAASQFLGIDLLQSGILLRRIQQGRDLDGVDPIMLAEITSALDAALEKRGLTEKGILNPSHCEVVADRVANMIECHCEKCREFHSNEND